MALHADLAKTCPDTAFFDNTALYITPLGVKAIITIDSGGGGQGVRRSIGTRHHDNP